MTHPSLRPTVLCLLLLGLTLSMPRTLRAQQANLHVRIEAIEGAFAFDPVAKTSVIPLNHEVTFHIWVANRGDAEATGALVNGGADPAFFEIRAATIDPPVAVCEVNPLGFFLCPQMTLPAGDSALVQVTGVGLMLTTAAQKTSDADFSTTTGGPNAGSDDDITSMDIVEAAATVTPATAIVPANDAQDFSAYLCPPDANGNPNFGDDGVPGTSDDFCIPVNADWAASSGIGTVDPATGLSTTFTAADVPPGQTASGAVIARVGTDNVFSNVLVEGPPVVATDILYIDPPDADIPADSTQVFGSFRCPLDANGKPDLGPDGIPATADDDCVQVFADWSVSGNIGTVDPLTGATTTLSATLPPGSTFEQGQVTAISDNETANADVTVVKTGAILGVAWDDEDMDGQVDPNEPRLAGWTIYVDLNNNGMLDGGEPSAVTDASGLYTIGNLEPGTYVVREVQQAGFVQTFPRNPDHYTVTLAEGAFVGGRRFSNRPQSEVPQEGSIHGKVFHDNDGDGLQAGSEEGRDDVVVALKDTDGNVIRTTTTMSSDLDGDGQIDPVREKGLYGFDFLEGGDYRVSIQAPDGFEQTVTPPAVVVLQEGGRVEDQDFGLYDEASETYSVRGRKFLDHNGNGKRDAGEPFINGWTIQVHDIEKGKIVGGDFITRAFFEAPVVSSTVTMDIDGEPGSFRFEGLERGKSLGLSEESRSGFRRTSPLEGAYDGIAISMLGPEPRSIEFGNQLVGLELVQDSGDGEALRKAIEDCNALPPSDPPCKIETGGGGKRASATIRLTRPLPPITRPLVLDGGGTTILDGTDAGDGVHGLVLSAGGTDIQGLTITGFSGHGLFLDGEGRNRLIGNVITGSGGDGIHVASGSPNLLAGNTVYGNGGVALDVGGDGPTPNDADETDGVQNYPTLTAVTIDADTTVVEGTLASTPDASFTLEFFASRFCNKAGHGEGETFLGPLFVFTDSLGQAAFTVRFDTTFAERHLITATATNADGATSEFSPCDASVATGLEHEQPAQAEVPAAFRLHANYPNPFNPETVIRFDVPHRARVRLQVFDVLGRMVATLVDQEMTPGSHRAVFDARGWPSGAYFYRLEAGAFSATRAMVLLK